MNAFSVCMVIIVSALAATDAPPVTGISPPQADSFWDLVGTIEVENYAGNPYCVGCGLDGSYLWVTNGAGQSGEPTGQILIFEENGTFVTSFEQNNAPGWGLRDLCFNGTYIYGSVSSFIDYYDTETYEKVGAFIGPQDPNRALAYDGIYFYTGNFGNEIYRLTWDGVSGSTAGSSVWSTAATTVYGAAWDAVNGVMWVTSADGSGTVAQLDQNGELIDNYYPVTGGTYGGATMSSFSSPVNTLWILNQGATDEVLGYDLNPCSPLQRDTWGSIKSIF